MKLNKKYTDDKIAKLDKEQKANENKLKADFDKGKITKEQLDSELLSLDKKYKAETYDLRKKEFEREKKMKVAQALIAGSMAVLNSLALGFPVGLIGAAVIAVKTAIDIKKIKGAKFEGRSGGYVKNAGVVQGSRHGSRYGEAGIAMYDRVTGEEVGEIEGGEALAVMSRDTVKHNGPIIDRLVDSSLNRNGAPITMASGGYVSLGETPFIPGQMLLFGGKKKKAKAQAAAAQAEADAAMAEADSMGSEGGGEGLSEENRAIIEKNSKTAEEQLKAAKDTAENTGAIAEILNTHSGLLERIANKDNGAGSILHAIDSLNYTMSKATFK
jgi:hypothetical protein